MATKLHAKDTQLGMMSLAAASVSGDTLEAAFYKITGKGTTSVTALPAALSSGYFFRGSTTDTLAAGDTAQKVTLNQLCTATEATISFTKDTDEDTSQCDTAKSYSESEFSDISVSINAYNSPDDSYLTDLEEHFVEIIEHTSTGGVTLNSISTATVWLIAKENDTTTSGEVEKTAFIPLALSEVAKTLNLISGPQEFNISAKGKGSDLPQIYYRTVA